MDRWRRAITLVVATILTATSVAPALAADTVTPDAAAYSRAWGIGVDEGSRRLAVMDAAGGLQESLLAQDAATFGGLWVEHDPFAVVVAFTPAHQGSIDAMISGDLAAAITTTIVPFAYAELEAVQAQLGATKLGAVAAIGIDVRNNRIRVETLAADAGLAAVAAAQSRASGGPSVETEIVEGLGGLSADIYGGLATSDCTTGFAVKSTSTGEKGVTVAAHCANSQVRSGTTLPFRAAAFGGSSDVQWNAAPSPAFTVRNYAYDGIPPLSYRTITGKKARSGQAVGNYVCKYGKSTLYGCGYISDISYDPPDTSAWGPIPNDNATYIRLHDPYGADLSSPGDSGGPFYSGHTAYGTMVGYCCTAGESDAIYMATNYLEGPLGVTVLTQ